MAKSKYSNRPKMNLDNIEEYKTREIQRLKGILSINDNKLMDKSCHSIIEAQISFIESY